MNSLDWRRLSRKRKGVTMATVGVDKIPSLLYLGCNYNTVFTRPHELNGAKLIVIPEVKALVSYPNLPPGIEILLEEAINPTYDHVAIHEPPCDVLERIRDITERGEVDLVVIDHSLKSGLVKAGEVAWPLRQRTIVMGKALPPEELYRALGYTCFVSEMHFHRALKLLLGLGRR